MPLLTPVTIPAVVIVATPGVPDAQVPPTVASVRVVVAPTASVVAPVIAATVGTAATVTYIRDEAESCPFHTVT